jgi:outer membrane protein
VHKLIDNFIRCPILVILWIFFSSNVNADTLNQAMINAFNNSDELKIQRASIRETDEKVAIEVAGKRIKIQAKQNLSTGYSFSTSCGGFCTSTTAGASLEASTSILDGGRADIKMSIAEAEVKIERSSLKAAEQSVLLTAVKAFMDLRRNMEFVALEKNSVKLLQKEVQAAQDRFAVGEITKTDISFAESRLEAAKGKLANQTGLLEIAKEQYEMVIGSVPGELDNPPPLPKMPSMLKEAKSLAAQNHSQIFILKQKVIIADLALDLSKASYRPTLDVSGGISDSSQTSKLSTNVSVQATAVLYTGGSRSSSERSALTAVQKARSQLLYNTKKIQQTVANRWAQLNIARALIVANRKQIKAAETAYRGVKDEAEFGLRTTLDILDAEQSLMAAKVQLASTKRDEYVAAYELLKAMGLLTTKNLNLNVEQYDVTKNYKAVRNAPRKNQFFKLDNLLKRWGQ